jgi:hypothetical protein
MATFVTTPNGTRLSPGPSQRGDRERPDEWPLLLYSEDLDQRSPPPPKRGRVGKLKLPLFDKSALYWPIDVSLKSGCLGVNRLMARCPHTELEEIVKGSVYAVNCVTQNTKSPIRLAWLYAAFATVRPSRNVRPQ